MEGDGRRTRLPVFGEARGGMPKAVALNVLSFLPSKDLYQASCVSKLWDALANDDAFWHVTPTPAPKPCPKTAHMHTTHDEAMHKTQ
jgi:hypothetical protein